MGMADDTRLLIADSTKQTKKSQNIMHPPLTAANIDRSETSSYKAPG
jgi:hypothetical protein